MNHTSGTDYSTLHLGHGLETNVTSGTIFRPKCKKRHLGKNRKLTHTSGFFPNKKYFTFEASFYHTVLYSYSIASAVVLYSTALITSYDTVLKILLPGNVERSSVDNICVCAAIAAPRISWPLLSTYGAKISSTYRAAAMKCGE